MATVTIFPIASTSTLPRTSASVSYSGAGAAQFQVLSNTWVSDSAAIAVDFQVQQSFDSGASWLDMCATTWQPGALTDKGNLPALVCTASSTDTKGSRLLRAVLSASAPINVGISATVA